MSIQENPYSLRLDKPVMAKIKHIAKINGRSVNKEIEFRMKAVIADFEKENGEIEVAKDAGDY